MGTIIVNGKRFDGNAVTVRDGKVVVDGTPQDGDVRGDVEARVVEDGAGRAECVASVSCGAGGDVSTGAVATTGRAIHVAAFASAGNVRGKTNKR